MQTAKQKSGLPTRKLSIGATVAPVIAIYAQPAVAEVWPQIAPAILAGPGMTDAAAALAGALAGVFVAWWVPDAPNVAVPQ